MNVSAAWVPLYVAVVATVGAVVGAVVNRLLSAPDRRQSAQQQQIAALQTDVSRLIQEKQLERAEWQSEKKELVDGITQRTADIETWRKAHEASRLVVVEKKYIVFALRREKKEIFLTMQHLRDEIHGGKLDWQDVLQAIDMVIARSQLEIELPHDDGLPDNGHSAS